MIFKVLREISPLDYMPGAYIFRRSFEVDIQNHPDWKDGRAVVLKVLWCGIPMVQLWAEMQGQGYIGQEVVYQSPWAGPEPL